MNEQPRPRSLRRVWTRNTLVIGALALVALVALDGRQERLALVGCALLAIWNTTTIVRSWVFLTGYRWFWWWRR